MKDDQKQQLLLAVALVGIVIASAVVGPAMLYPDSAPTGEASTPTPTPLQGTVQDFDDADTLNYVPGSHVRTETDTKPPQVKASAGSQTMQVETTLVDGEPALKLSDDDTHSGRWVSVPTDWLERVHGEVPSTVTIRHESGSVYMESVRVRGDSAAFYVRGFSTNTVTFSGETTIHASPATNGSTFEYGVTDLQSVSNYQINITGHRNMAWDNETGSIRRGGTTPINVGGTSDPVGPSVNDKPTLTLTGDRAVGSTDTSAGELIGCNDNGRIKKTVVVKNAPDKIERIKIDVNGHFDDDLGDTDEGNVSIYFDESEDDNMTDGQKVWSDYYVINDSDPKDTFVLDNTINRDNLADDKIYISFITEDWTDSDGGSCSDYEVYGGISAGNVYSESPLPSSVDVDIGGTTYSYGAFSSGETKTQEVDVPVSETELYFTGHDGKVDWTLKKEEITDTSNVSIQVNGEEQSTGYNGILADGETASLEPDVNWVESGNNTVTVIAGENLSDDAPPAKVDVEYSHDSVEGHETDYQAAAWSERYNVSRTVTENRTVSSMTIPFADTVYSVDYVEMRINGGEWTAVSSSNYTFDGTELSVDVGTVDSGDTIQVRGAGTKVQVYNGTISVTDPTTPESDELDSRIQLDSWHQSSYIRISNESERVHYATNASWDTEAEEVRVTATGKQEMSLPYAPSSGGAATIRTIPVEAKPKNGGVQLTVNATGDEPAIDVSGGETYGDEVAYTYYGAESGTLVTLRSVTYDAEIASAIAESPVTLIDDDSKETLKFILDDGSSTGESGGGSGGGIITTDPDSFIGNLLPLSLVALLLGGLVVVSRNDDEVTAAGSGAAERVETRLDSIPVAGPLFGRLLGGVIRSGAQFATALVNNRVVTVGLAGALALAAIQSGVVQVPPSTMPILVLVGVAAGSWVALRETGNFSRTLFVTIVASSTLVTVVALSDTDPVAAVLESRVMPLLVVGGLYLAYRALSLLSDQFGDGGNGDRDLNINVQTDDGNSGGGD